MNHRYSIGQGIEYLWVNHGVVLNFKFQLFWCSLFIPKLPYLSDDLYIMGFVVGTDSIWQNIANLKKLSGCCVIFPVCPIICVQ